MSASPERPTEDDLLITAAGYERLRSELEMLRTVRRAELTEQLRAKAGAFG